jgi:putative abortive phage resistance protein
MVVAPNETLLGALGAEGTGAVGAVWDWFARRLNIIHPESMYMHLPARINADAVFSRAMSSGPTRADTGISGVRLDEMKMGALPVGADQLTGLLEGLRERGGTFVIAVGGADQAILSLTDEGEPTARRLVTVHEREDGPAPEQHSSFTLPLQEESDGTQRFMNLLPILFQLRDKNSRSVFVVDELENSMHPKLTEDFISSFLEGLGADDRRQLIFTTHEIQLMRSDLLRRDEIWLADKVDGQSRLTRVSDFAGIGVRKDADLLSFYMSGRLGGVPRI